MGDIVLRLKEMSNRDKLRMLGNTFTFGRVMQAVELNLQGAQNSEFIGDLIVSGIKDYLEHQAEEEEIQNNIAEEVKRNNRERVAEAAKY